MKNSLFYFCENQLKVEFYEVFIQFIFASGQIVSHINTETEDENLQKTSNVSF